MTVVASTLIAMIFAFLFVNTVYAVWLRRRLLALLEQRRAVFFRNTILNLTALVAAGALAVEMHPDLTAADVGWRLPEGNWSDYLYTGYFLILLVALYLRSRRSPLAPGTAALLPRTARERRLAAGMTVAVGIGEEFLYRALLPAVGTELLGLPLWVAAVASWALFVAAHVYQGRRALFTIGLLGLMFTMLYLSSMSLLLPILVHILWDAVFLLLVRPRPAVEAPVAEDVPVIVETPVAVEPLASVEPAGPVEATRLRAAAPE